MLKNKKGFTLIELIIVVAIMAVLVALLAPNVLKYLEKSRVGKDIQTLDAVRTALNAEIMDEELCDACTEETYPADANDKLGGSTFSAPTTEAIATLVTRIDDSDALDDDFFGTEIFGCKYAKGGQIEFFLDGKGGVAVVALNSEGKVAVDADGKALFVGTNLDLEDLDVELAE